MTGRSSYPKINILLVDDDPISLSILAKVLEKLSHNVVAFKSPLDALLILRTRKTSFDLVLTGVHMPEMSGLELLKIVNKDFKLPVVLMSTDKNIDIMLQGLDNGASFYLVKPISINYLSRLWQYAIPLDSTNKKRIYTSSNSTEALPPSVMPSTTTRPLSALKIHDQQRPKIQVNKKAQLLFTKKSMKRPNTNDLGTEDYSASKKPKLVWTIRLHNLFLQAINKYGIDKAMPKKILEYMNVPGLKREHVASHLQKYRLFLNRIQEVTNSMQGGILYDWNDRPLRSSFAINEITFLTNNFHQQYLEIMENAHGKVDGANFCEKDQSTTQARNLTEVIRPRSEAIPIDHTQHYPSQGTQTPNQNIIKLDQLPTLNGGQQISQDTTNLSNPRVVNLHSVTSNYIGLRISANGELLRPLNNSSTSNSSNGPRNDSTYDRHGGNYTRIISANEVNYESDYANNHNPFHNNNTSPSLDYNVAQKEYSNGIISPDLSSMHGIGDELRQLGIEFPLDEGTYADDFEFGYYGAQIDDLGTLFERLDKENDGSNLTN